MGRHDAIEEASRSRPSPPRVRKTRRSPAAVERDESGKSSTPKALSVTCAPRAIKRCPVQATTSSGPLTLSLAVIPLRAKRLQSRHPSRSAQCPHCPMGASLQMSTAAPEAWHRSGTLVRSGTTRGRTREEQRLNRLTIPRDALPTRLSSFCLLAMASPPRDTRRNPLISQHSSGIVSGVDSRSILPASVRAAAPGPAEAS
jgi:hypothetical protein